MTRAGFCGGRMSAIYLCLSGRTMDDMIVSEALRPILSVSRQHTI
jgi:hypothetical protein